MGTIQNGAAGTAGAAGSGSSPKSISNSARFRKGSSYLSRYPTIAGNAQKFTWSGWVKRGSYMSSKNHRFFVSSSATSDDLLRFSPDDNLQVYFDSAVLTCLLSTTAKFRDPAAWYHIVLAVDTTQAGASDRVKLYVNGQQITALDVATYPSQNYNVKGFNSTNVHNIGCNPSINPDEEFDGYMAEVHFVDGQQLMPSSFGFYDYTGVWRAKTVSGLTYGNNGFYLPFDNTSVITGGNAIAYSEDFTNAIFTKERASITSNSTTGPNGVQTADTITEDSTATSTHRWYFNSMTMANGSTYTASIYAKAGTRSAVALEIWNGSTAKYCYADLSNGTVISGSDASATVTSVGSGWYRLTVQHTGLGNAGSGSSLYLMPAAVNNVTYSGNGSGNAYIWGAQIALTTESAFMYLPTNGTAVASGATYLGQDKSLGSSITYGNNWNAVMSMTVGTSYDAMTDAPYPVSATVGNYCTLDPLNNGNAVTPTITLSDANLKVVFGNTNTNAIAGTTIGMTSGKFYCEGQITVVGGTYPFIGLIPFSSNLSATNSSISTYSTYWAGNGTLSANDIIGMAFDATNGTLQFYKNGSTLGSLITGIAAGTWMFAVSGFNGNTWIMNFGQRPFAYTPPTGYNRLNTYNLSAPTIARPKDYFDTLLWRGQSTSAGRSFTGLAFQPDMIWSSYRTAAGQGAASKPIADSVRGVGKAIFSDQNAAESSAGAYALTSTSGPGFATYYVPTSASNYVSWSGTAVGSGAFTFECWFYSTDFSAAQTLLGTTDSAGLSIRLGSTNVSVDRYNQGADNFSTPSTLNTNTWYHIAVTRDSGGTMTVFVNGTRSPTGTALTTADFKTVKYLGTLNPSDSYPVIGGMSNARLVVGSNVYNPASSTITVPTSALTAVTNTKLLTLQNSTLIDNSTNAYTLTYTGFTPGVVYGYVSSFDSNGFTTAAGSTSNSEYNLNNRDFVGWFWKKGATPGFDIVTYTGTGSGRTIAHSLGATPAFIIVKNRSATSQWIVWHKVFDNNNYLQLNATAAAQNGGTSMWNSSAHTSSVFSIGTDGAVNTNGQSYVAYLWSEVAGFSKFGSYAANASTDGPFVYCGFKPRWIMIKRYDSSGPAWRCYDTARKSYNPQGFDAYMNATTEETSNAYFDVTSNGFKIRTTDGDLNASGGSYIFMAFADEPFRTATAHSDANKTTAVSLTAPTSVDYLVVAGGAGGGAINDVSGGGGGGGVRYGSVSVSTGIAYTATVGGGGTGAVNGTGAASTNGTNSSLSGSGLTTINASGGGAGGSWDSSGSSGGCGGGAAGKAAGGALSGSSGNAGAYSPVEGYDGGGSLHTPGNNAGGGGGGGAGAVGQTAPSIAQGGSGGAGYLWSNGSYYGGGGGGASTQSGVAGAGGAGGGGAGVAGGLGASGSSATVNTGGGGGAGRRGNGGDGGSGIVIIRYPDSFKTATSTTGSPTVTISGGYRYYTFTGTGTITF